MPRQEKSWQKNRPRPTNEASNRERVDTFEEPEENEFEKSEPVVQESVRREPAAGGSPQGNQPNQASQGQQANPSGAKKNRNRRRRSKNRNRGPQNNQNGQPNQNGQNRPPRPQGANGNSTQGSGE
jgi:hypothetical protein